MENLLLAGLAFIFLGFILILLGLLKQGKIEHGGLILIGPFPIVWGSSKAVVLLILLMAIIILAFLIWYSIII
jgi:uncharacterized protein (TIGR00304 family)